MAFIAGDLPDYALAGIAAMVLLFGLLVLRARRRRRRRRKGSGMRHYFQD